MAWVKVDDGFFGNPKVIAAGRDARDLYLAALCFCNQGLTDGFVPAAALRRLGADADIDNPACCAQRLVDVGLWTVVDGGYQVHQYLDYQPSAESVKEKREAAAERMRNVRSRELRANNERTSREVRSTPTQPVPSRKEKEPEPVPSIGLNGAPDAPGADAPPKPKRAQEVPEDWQPGASERSWAEREGFSAADIERQLPVFRDHYRGQGKPMKDWAATWRNWMRRSRDDPRFAARPRASPNGTGPPKRASAYDILAVPTNDEGTLKW